MNTQVTVAAVEGQSKIVLGFSNETFSQAVYLPVESVEEIQKLGLGLFNALVTEAEKVIACQNQSTSQSTPTTT